MHSHRKQIGHVSACVLLLVCCRVGWGQGIAYKRPK